MGPVACLVERRNRNKYLLNSVQGTSYPLSCLFSEFYRKRHNIRQQDIIKRNGHFERDCNACQMLPKREKITGGKKDNIEGDLGGLDESPASLTKLRTTRWTVRATSFQRIIDN